MSNKWALLILAVLAAWGIAWLALLPLHAHAAEYVFRHRLVMPIQVAAAPAPEIPEMPAEPEIPQLAVTSSWSDADWQAFDALDGVTGDLIAFISVDGGVPWLNIETGHGGCPRANGAEIRAWISGDASLGAGGSATLPVGEVYWMEWSCDGSTENYAATNAPALPPLSITITVPADFTGWGGQPLLPLLSN